MFFCCVWMFILRNIVERNIEEVMVVVWFFKSKEDYSGLVYVFLLCFLIFFRIKYILVFGWICDV